MQEIFFLPGLCYTNAYSVYTICSTDHCKPTIIMEVNLYLLKFKFHKFGLCPSNNRFDCLGPDDFYSHFLDLLCTHSLMDFVSCELVRLKQKGNKWPLEPTLAYPTASFFLLGTQASVSFFECPHRLAFKLVERALCTNQTKFESLYKIHLLHLFTSSSSRG